MIVDSEMLKIESKFGKPPSCWNLEYIIRYSCAHTPVVGFLFQPAPLKIQSQPSNAADMEASL